MVQINAKTIGLTKIILSTTTPEQPNWQPIVAIHYRAVMIGKSCIYAAKQ
jgi:hypothetical protein